MFRFLLFVLAWLCLYSQPAYATKVTYVANTNEVTSYWQQVFTVAKAAAKDLDIELQIIKGQGHPVLQAKIIQELSQQKNKPELLIFSGYLQNAFETFTLLEQAKIPFITLSNFSAKTAFSRGKAIGLPQEKFSYWLAEHFIDNAQGGYLLADTLIKEAKQVKGSTNILKVLSFRGDFSANSQLRNIGLTKRIKDSNDAILVQDIIAYWRREDAKERFIRLFTRHNGIDIVWASSDYMALGALDAAMELNLRPNKDIFIGGFDWNELAIENIKDNKLTSSVGGNVFSLAWLLVKVYDHFHNIEVFQGGMQDASVHFFAATNENAAQLTQLVNDEEFSRLRFYCFSKTYKPQAPYNFSLTSVQKQLANKDNNRCH